jgi:uncharacterized protein YndB with AHSA1/START domain
MAPIVNSIEISRRPEDVFTYLTNPSHLPDWQESAVSVRGEAGPSRRGLAGGCESAGRPHGEVDDE